MSKTEVFTEGMKAIGKKTETNITGRVEQAMLIVDDRSREMNELLDEKQAFDKKSLKQLKKSSEFKKKGKSLGEWAEDQTHGLDDNDNMLTDIKRLSIPVQFNPSELMLNSSLQDMADLALLGMPQNKPAAQNGEAKTDAQAPAGATAKNDHKKGDATSNTVVDEPLAFPTNTLTVTLYFDEMRPTDAFIMDKLAILSATGAVNAGINTVADAASKRKPHSVKTVVEGMLALLGVKGSSTVTFYWNNFSFKGTVSTVQANYTMFNNQGAPVRATVLLRLQQKMDESQSKNWHEAFKTAFSGDMVDLSRAQDKVSSVFNLQL